jgi:hypothetical protein
METYSEEDTPLFTRQSPQAFRNNNILDLYGDHLSSGFPEFDSKQEPMHVRSSSHVPNNRRTMPVIAVESSSPETGNNTMTPRLDLSYLPNGINRHFRSTVTSDLSARYRQPKGKKYIFIALLAALLLGAS